LKSNGYAIRTEIKLYEAVVLSTLLYGSETWPMMVANGKKPDVGLAHNKWLRRILHNYLQEGQDYKQTVWERTGRYGKHHKNKTTLDGTRGEDGGRKTGYTDHGLESGREAWKRQTAKELARKLYVKTFDAWIQHGGSQ